MLHDRIRLEMKSKPILLNIAKAWLQYKKTCRQQAILFMREHRDHAKTKAAALTVAISIFRGIKSGELRHPSAAKLASRDFKLSEALHRDTKTVDPKLSNVQQYISSTFRSHPTINPESLRKPNFLRTAKNTLPSEKKNLPFLYSDTGDRCEDSSVMAEMLKAAWNLANPKIKEHLADYDKTLSFPVQDGSLELVTKVISRRRPPLRTRLFFFYFVWGCVLISG